MNEMEKAKACIKEIASETCLCIRFTVAMLNEVETGYGDLLIDALMEQMGKLRKKREPEQGDTCGEGPGVCKYTCDAKEEDKEKTVLYMDFGSAIKAVKRGKSVARKGWNGKHQYVELATCISYKGNAGEIVNCHHNNIGNCALAFIGTSGVQMGWLASQADMLAEDWYVVE